MAPLAVSAKKQTVRSMTTALVNVDHWSNRFEMVRVAAVAYPTQVVYVQPCRNWVGQMSLERDYVNSVQAPLHIDHAVAVRIVSSGESPAPTSVDDGP